MKIQQQKNMSSEDVLRKALRDEDVHVIMHTGGPDYEDIIGFVVNLDREKMSAAFKEQVLCALGASQQTIDFFESATKEEKEQIKNLALISHHKKELAKLEALI